MQKKHIACTIVKSDPHMILWVPLFDEGEFFNHKHPYLLLKETKAILL